MKGKERGKGKGGRGTPSKRAGKRRRWKEEHGKRERAAKRGNGDGGQNRKGISQARMEMVETMTGGTQENGRIGGFIALVFGRAYTGQKTNRQIYSTQRPKAGRGGTGTPQARPAGTPADPPPTAPPPTASSTKLAPSCHLACPKSVQLLRQVCTIWCRDRCRKRGTTRCRNRCRGRQGLPPVKKNGGVVCARP